MRIAVAMSGGADSLRVAVLLREQGHDVLGMHMRLFPPSLGNDGPSGLGLALRESRLEESAEHFAIPLEIVDLRQEFERLVVRPFINAYRHGLTPNPCVLCNPRIKFGCLADLARQRGAGALATGHYAKVFPPDRHFRRFRLAQALDLGKDQSYFLYDLSQEQLAFARFPLGSHLKQEVRRWVEQVGLDSTVPEESQEICFIPDGPYTSFLRGADASVAGSSTGPILDLGGIKIGEHRGIFGYTVGQRRGLGLVGGAPYYVVHIDAHRNALWVGRAEDLFRTECRVESVNWVSIAAPIHPIRCRVRIRNQHRPADAWVQLVEAPSRYLVRFDQPQRAVTPGQAAVFYDADTVLGGGTIAPFPPPSSDGCGGDRSPHPMAAEQFP